jgi:hypothetical protein
MFERDISAGGQTLRKRRLGYIVILRKLGTRLGEVYLFEYSGGHAEYIVLLVDFSCCLVEIHA